MVDGPTNVGKVVPNCIMIIQNLSLKKLQKQIMGPVK